MRGEGGEGRGAKVDGALRWQRRRQKVVRDARRATSLLLCSPYTVTRSGAGPQGGVLACNQ